ncbi:thermonuclease family protein [Brucella intermedia]|uniref:thermonuclease family protein n=1 Tax=Brucella intermedia TaxID=94625 RepID=UPI00124DEB3E|nr:thermonuclease family protein [Brucella intermedia]KAB2716276.1 thermonuclease family protein [Brucella intermedia]
MKRLILCTSVAFVLSQAHAADKITQHPSGVQQAARQTVPAPVVTIKGRAVAMDGRTLWFPTYAQRIRLADIDACELPQWALTPQQKKGQAGKFPAPVPCGPFAKAWLKRTVGAEVVTCTVTGYDADAVARAYCAVRNRDLGLEMLRVGWARVDSPILTYPEYMGYQRAAMSARYGMWATNVLDMNEWRAKAVDKTLERHPFADFNLLAERKSEISPPFADARNRPRRTDR